MKGIGPFLNRDFQGQDRPQAIFSKMPIALQGLTDYQIFFDDFLASVNDGTNQWIVVKDSGASALIGTGDVENGALTLLSAADTENDGASIQRAETTFLVKAGKKLMFEARVKVGDADQGEIFIGLAENFATNPEAVIVNGIARVGFELVDGSAAINTVIDNDTTATRTVLSQSMSDATYVRLGFMTDGASIRFYVNRSLVSTQAIPAAIAAITLGPAFMHLSGDATGTDTAAIDYVLVCQERL
jgi:hypothetical protein